MIKNFYGFNFQWMLHYNPVRKRLPFPVDETALDLIRELGFNFVRVPMDYRYWISDFAYDQPNEDGLAHIDRYIELCRYKGLHICLNIHRVPGYCIMNNEWEKHNLWTDQAALDGLILQWEMFSHRYKHISSEELSFDLINEPPNVDQYSCSRENHERVIRSVYKAIKEIDPDRLIFIDGLGGGNLALPEMKDLDVIQSCRGYQPMGITHYKAPWGKGRYDSENLKYPDFEWEGIVWNKSSIEDFYKPWVQLSDENTKIHVGEFGCYTGTPNDIALKWFDDVLSFYHKMNWGYSLWEFSGTFGLDYHGRPGTRYEDINGYRIDRDLLDLLTKYKRN